MPVIAVIGSRNYKRLDKINTRLTNLAGAIFDASNKYPFGDKEVTIISGGAHGVDKEAVRVAYLLQFKVHEFLPNMPKDGYDVREYHRRNDQILKAADKVIAFWDGESKGTGSVIEKALAMRKDVEVIFDD